MKPIRLHLAVTAIIIGAALTFMSCGGSQERKTHYRAKAQEFIQAGNFPKARVALRNVLKIDPRDPEAYFLFAQVEEKEKNWRSAVANYQRVLELVPDHKDALIALAKYYLEAHLAEEVVEAAAKVLVKDPQNPQAAALEIAVSAQREMTVQALAEAEALSLRHPAEPDVAVLLATLYSRDERLRDAEAVLRRAIEAHPHHLDLLNNLKTVLVKGRDVQGAERVLRQMIEEEPTIFDHRLRLAQFLDQQKAIDQAEAVLREASALLQGEQPWLALVDFLDTRRGKQAAEAAFLDAVQRLPYSTKIRFALARFCELHREEAKAREVYESLVEEYGKKPAGQEAHVKIAALDFLAGRREEAEQRLGAVLKNNPRSAEGLTLQAKIALSKRSGKEAVQALRIVTHDQPDLAHAQFLLGQAHRLSGELQLARESFQRAIWLYPQQVEAKLSLAMLDTQSGQSQRARERLQEVVKGHADHLIALEMLFALDLAVHDWVQASATLNLLRAAVGDSPVVNMAKGKLHEAQGRFDKAAAAFQQAAAQNPDALEPLLALIKLDLRQKQLDRAHKRLTSILGDRADHPYAHGLLGEVLLVAGHRDEAATEFRNATRFNPTWVTPWLNWATLVLTQHTPDRAIQVLKDGIAANAASEELHMLLASVYSKEGQIDMAIKTYEAVLHLNPNNVFSANNLAVLLTDYRGDVASLFP
jgi:tetratricopeptide (TPR) repeat protein